MVRSILGIRFGVRLILVAAVVDGCAPESASVASSVSPAAGAQTCVWRTVATADPSWGESQLVAVAAPTPVSAWTVGNTFTGQEAGRAASLVEHWNGHRWTLVPRAAPADVFLTDVSADAPNDVWTVGRDRTDGGAFAEHWDGRHWRRAVLPQLRGGATLYGVDVVRADDVWAVGARSSPDSTLVLHWDGTRWSVVPSPSPPPTPLTARPAAALQSVAARSADDVWAVGESVNVAPAGQSTTLILHWNGRRWSRVPSPSPRTKRGKANDILFAIAATGPSDAWAVGDRNSQLPGWGGGGDHTLAEHWNGHRWHVVPTPTSTHRIILYGILATPTTVVAVGDQAEPYRTLVAQRTTAGWRTQPTQPGSLADIAQAPGGRLWAVGQRANKTLALACTP